MDLKNLILERLSGDDLLAILNENYLIDINSLIFGEFAKRLRNAEENPIETLETFEILDQIPIEIIKNNKTILNALYEYKKSIPWRISIIYDYRNGRIKHIEASIGFTGRYKYKDIGVVFTWLECNRHKLMLREITNKAKKLGKISMQLDVEKSSNVIDMLLNTDKIVLKYSTYFYPVNTFGNPLSEAESFEIFPWSITSIRNSLNNNYENNYVNDKNSKESHINFFYTGNDNKGIEVNVEISKNIQLFKKIMKKI